MSWITVNLSPLFTQSKVFSKSPESIVILKNVTLVSCLQSQTLDPEVLMEISAILRFY